MMITNEKQDRFFLRNKMTIERGLVRGSELTGYEIKQKAPQDRFDNQSKWLIIYYKKDGEEFRTIRSHKNNQYLRIE